MSLAISIRAETPVFDGRQFTDAMDRELEKLFFDAARAFLIAAVRRIPVRTGFLRGAFTTLEDVIGAFEFTSSVHKGIGAGKRGGGLGSRPGKGATETALRLVRARNRQIKLLKRISILKQREANRHQKVVQNQDELRRKLQGRESPQAREKAAGRTRGKALRDRRLRQSLIKQAQLNQANIEKLVSQVEKKYKINLGKRLGDAIRSNELALEALRERRERKFFRVLKNLNARRYGRGQNFTFSKNANPSTKPRIASTLGEEEYRRRVTRLRGSMKGQNIAMQRIQKQIDASIVRYSKGINKKRLDKLRIRLLKRLTDRAKQKGLDEEAAERQALKELRDASLKSLKHKIERSTAGHPLLALVAERQRIENLRHATFASKRLKGIRGETPLNIVALVSGAGRSRIAGQTVAGKFDLREGERVSRTFKLIEFYYPSKGRAGRVQKTPRSGRQFATPPSQIITKEKTIAKPNVELFKQLSSFRQAAGLPVPPELREAARQLSNANGTYIFNFGVNIKYLAINEIQQAWFAWTAGIQAFNRHIAANFGHVFPNPGKFFLKRAKQTRGPNLARS